MVAEGGGCLEALDGPGAFDSCMITREMLGAGELGGRVQAFGVSSEPLTVEGVVH